MVSNIRKIKENFDQYLVRPLNFFGFGGFVFDVAGESSVFMQNEITDHYAEDNSTVQDHIAVRPKRVTLKNYVGELSDIVESTDQKPLQKITQKLTVLNGILPTLSTAAQQAQTAIQQRVTQGLDIRDIDLPDQAELLDIYAVVKNFSPPVTRQEQAYMYFKALRDQKILLSIQTPFEFMTNMAVETVVGRQPEDSAFVMDFTVTLKQMRFAGTEFAPISSQGRGALQRQSQDDRTKIAGKDSNTSILRRSFPFLDDYLTGEGL